MQVVRNEVFFEDINLEPVTLYNGLQSVKSVENKFNDLLNSMNNVDLGDVSLSNAYLLSYAKNLIKSINDEKIFSLIQRLEKNKSLLEKIDDNAALLFYLLKEENVVSDSDFVSVFDAISYSDEDGFRYITDVDKLYECYNNGSLKVNDQSLYLNYNLYDENGKVIKNSGKDYINSLLNGLKKNYSGRELAVNTALLILQLSADKNVRIPYRHKGTGANPYVSIDSVMSGVDCNAFVSAILNQAIPDGFEWKRVGQFKNIGKEILPENYSQAKPGDIFVRPKDITGLTGLPGHVGIIVANDPETGQFITAEATDGAIKLKIQTYNAMENYGWYVQDLSEVYAESC